MSESQYQKRNPLIQKKCNSLLVTKNHYNHKGIIEELKKLNAAQFDSFVRRYEIIYKEPFNENNLVYVEGKSIEDGVNNKIMFLAAQLPPEEDDPECELVNFPVPLLISDKSEKYQYLIHNVEEENEYFCEAEYINSYEIKTTNKNFKSFCNFLRFKTDYFDPNNDPLSINTNILSKLLDYGIPASFLAEFNPKDTCFEISTQLIDTLSGTLYGPIYVKQNNY